MTGKGTSPNSFGVCAICGAEETQPLYEKRGYPLIRCHRCGLIYVPSSALGQSLSDYYQEGYFTGDKATVGYPDYEDDEIIIRRNFSRRLDYIEEIKPPGRILDVGAAFGYFLDEAKSRGWDTYGIDISAHAASAAREKLRLEVASGDFLEYDFGDRSFDVISMFDVIEHFEKPVRCIEKAYSLLREDGLLVMETGDTDSVPARLLRSRWYFYNPPQHVFHFSSANLCSVLRDCGFYHEIIVKKVGRRVSVRNLMFKLGALTKFQFLRRTMIELQKRIKKNPTIYVRFGDDICVFAGKSEKSFRGRRK